MPDRYRDMIYLPVSLPNFWANRKRKQPRLSVIKPLVPRHDDSLDIR